MYRVRQNRREPCLGSCPCSPASAGSTSGSNAPDTHASAKLKSTPTAKQSSITGGRWCRNMTMYVQLGSGLMTLDSLGTLTLFAVDSPVKTCPWPAEGPDSRENVPGCSGMPSGSPRTSTPNGCCWRTFPAYSQATREGTWESFSGRWATQGFVTSNGECWIRSSTESPNAAVECSLSQVLEPETDTRFLLSVKAAQGILRRAERRGRTLPEPLRSALVALSGR